MKTSIEPITDRGRERQPAEGAFWVEVERRQEVIRRYGAPFQAAAWALAGEISRRLESQAGFAVVVRQGDDLLARWDATQGVGFKALRRSLRRGPDRAARREVGPASPAAIGQRRPRKV